MPHPEKWGLGGFDVSDRGRRRFKALLFDLYDTLVWLDVPTSNRGRERFAERAGVALGSFMRVWRRSVDDRMRGKGGSLPDHLASTLAELGVPHDPAMIADLVAIEQQRLVESVHFYPGTVPVLRRLAAAGYRLGLVSNISDGVATPITYLGIDGLFHQLILSYEVGLVKPEPAIFELACRRLEASPEETMFVADGGFGELDAAHRLGIYSVMLEQDNQSKDFGFSTLYDTKIRDVVELEPLLQALRGPVEP